MLAALAASPASAATTTAGNPTADAPVVASLEAKFAATEIFANCADKIEIMEEPGEPENTPGGPGYQCEYRVAVGGEVVKGQDEVVADPKQANHYLLVNTAVEGRAPSAARTCVLGRGSGLLAHRALLRGSACGSFTRNVVGEIEDRAFHAGFHGEPVPKRLPAHFVVGDSGEDEVGFVVNRFRCQGRTRSFGTPGLRWTATCLTQFGDGIKVSFAPFR